MYVITIMTSKQTVTENRAILTRAYHDHQVGLNAHAFYKVSNRQTGEDMVQSTFLKTWRYLLRGGEIELMRAFLYKVLNNLVVDEYRKRKTVSLETFLEKGVEPSTEGDEKLINLLDAKAAVQLIEKLPLKYQKIMRMRYVQDLSIKEMAILTGQSRNTIAVQAYRGLIKLRLLYKG